LLSASCWFLAWFSLRPWRWRTHVPLKRRLTFNGPRGVVSTRQTFCAWHSCTSASTSRWQNSYPSFPH
jgi:hypothetical protein